MPIYRHVIPHRFDELSRVKLPELRIEGQTLSCREFSSGDFSVELDENTLLARDLGWNVDTTLSSSSFVSSDSLDSEEEGE